MITLYGMGSPNVIKVLLMLEEAGLEYEYVRRDVILGEQFRPDFLALNPLGKVPVIVDNDGPNGEPFSLSESGAILVYLAEKTGAFLPEAGADRYLAVQWLMFQMSGAGPIFGQAIHFTSVAPGQSYPEYRFTTEMHRLLEVADQRLAQHPFLAGEGYSIADMALAPWFQTLRRFFPNLEGVDNLISWEVRLLERAAVRRVMALWKEMGPQEAASFKAATPAMLDRYFGRKPSAR